MKIDGKANAFILSIFLRFKCAFAAVALSHIYRIKIDDTFSTNLFTVSFYYFNSAILWQNETAIKNRLPICLSTLSHTYKVLSAHFYGASFCSFFVGYRTDRSQDLNGVAIVIRISDKITTAKKFVLW